LTQFVVAAFIFLPQNGIRARRKGFAMLRSLIALMTLAATLAGTALPAAAQYYDPYYRGYYPPPPPPPSYYYEGPRYAPGGWRPAYVDRHGVQTYYPRHGRCPRGYTVQDGVCKPYRGY
jgi:hypothetical protein